MRDTENVKTYRDHTPFQAVYQKRFDVFGTKAFEPAFLNVVEKKGGDGYGVGHERALLILTATVVTEVFGGREDVGYTRQGGLQDVVGVGRDRGAAFVYKVEDCEGAVQSQTVRR